MSHKNERQKALERYNRAAEKAAESRDSNRGLRDSYRADSSLRASMERKLIADLIRVFNDPDNPYAGWAASRKRYRELGRYPEIMVADLFGTHAEFERAAGLRDKRGTSKTSLVTATLHTEKEIRRYAEAHVLRHVGKHDLKLRDRHGEKLVMVASDLHSQFLDPFAWAVFVDTAKRYQPDVVIINGDAVDFPKVGRFVQMPGAGALSIQSEIDFVRQEVFARLRKACPNAVITYHVGNHEQRLIRYLADTAPGLADLRCLQFDQLFGIEEFDIAMVFGGNFLAPRQKDRDENIRKTYKVYFDCFAVSHGHSISKTAAEEELKRFGMSGTSGHTHRPQLVTVPTLACPTASWTSTGMMAGFAVGKDYVDGPSAWTMGFGLFVVVPSKELVIPQNVLVHENHAHLGGVSWEPTREALAIRRAMWGENGAVTGHRRPELG